MPQTTELANQNKGTLFNSDFARGYASHGFGATSLTVKKGTMKKNYHLKRFEPAHCSACQLEQRCFALW